MLNVMFWRDHATGEIGRWPYTGQDPDEMCREAACYSEHCDKDYVLYQTDSPEHFPLNPFALIYNPCL